MSEQKMSLTGHLSDLRKRIIICIFALIVFSTISYIFVEEIIEFLRQPVGFELIFLSPAEAFITQIKVSVFLGFCLILPVIFFNIWSFIYPALKKEEKKYLNLLLPFVLIFFWGGIVFALLVIIPFGIEFLVDIAVTGLNPRFSLSNYISFILGISIPFGFLFQLPVIIFLLTKLNIINSLLLISSRKYVLVSIFLVAAILTPPDIISQVMLSLPLIVLYEGSIIMCKIVE